MASPGSPGVPSHPAAQRILVVDDEAPLRDLVREALTEESYEVLECADGERALAMIQPRAPDLVVLDLGLPGMNGLMVLRRIREFGDLPVIILSGRGHEADRVIGLELGADDYVTKPFSPRELAARIKSVLRRSGPGATGPTSDRLVFDGLVIDRRCRDVLVSERAIELTAKEFDLLAFLASAPRQVFTREQLLMHVWDSDPAWQDPSTVAEHVHRLRRKIEPDPAAPRWIQTMRGAGYRFTP